MRQEERGSQTVLSRGKFVTKMANTDEIRAMAIPYAVRARNVAAFRFG